MIVLDCTQAVMFHTILFAVDSSLEARQAVPVVVDLVKKYQARLILLSVTPADDPPLSTGQIDSLLHSAEKLFHDEGITPEIRTAEGKPAFVICDIADELDVKLIVMGTRGISPVENAESVSQRVISLSPCPVLVVP